MKALSYFRMVWKTNKAFAIFTMALLASTQLLILNLVTTFDTQAIIASIVEQLPKNMQVFLKESFFSTLTFDGAAAFGYNHPMVIALIIVNAINIPARHISRELESGTLEVLLSHPVKRNMFITTLWASGIVLLFLITLSAFLSSILGVYLFHQLSADVVFKILEISLNMWLFSVLILSYSLMIASKSKGGGLTGSLSAMIAFVFYVVFLISQLWSTLDFLLPYNIFYYYEPQQIMLGRGHIGLDTLVLVGLSGLCFGFSVIFFNKRDIP
ncbi:MAG: ABC transporter permease [Bacteroidales bacterium]|nr:ABC transporter permease [Bacteroidales bacterium]